MASHGYIVRTHMDEWHYLILSWEKEASTICIQRQNMLKFMNSQHCGIESWTLVFVYSNLWGTCPWMEMDICPNNWQTPTGTVLVPIHVCAPCGLLIKSQCKWQWEVTLLWNLLWRHIAVELIVKWHHIIVLELILWEPTHCGIEVDTIVLYRADTNY